MVNFIYNLEYQKINSPKYKRKNRDEDEVFDLDMIDLDQIDELEDKKDRGEFDDSFSESISESEEFRKKKKIKKVKKEKNLSKKEYIEVSDDESLNKKRKRIKGKKPIRHKFNKQVNFENKNVALTENYCTIIINKSILDREKFNDQDEEEMLNNDEKFSIAQNIEEENRKTKNIIKKFQTQSTSSAPKYTYMQEKLSQKELLLEAIFTEYYNIQSLQEMQRLEDLNKKEMSAPGKKQFAEFVKIKRGGQEENNTTLTFSNSIVYDKIFEGFKGPSTTPKEKKICVITGLPAKYFDPLTNQPYANLEAFKIIRERYFQKEEDALLYRIQTLSDFASQKIEKLKKYILADGASGSSQKNNINDMMSLVNKYGILKSEGVDNEKRIISRK
jgi:vacuolar protein sorting-associated protein 72